MKRETVAATRMSSTLQHELDALRHITASLSLDDTCCSCQQKLSDRPKCGLPYSAPLAPLRCTCMFSCNLNGASGRRIWCSEHIIQSAVAPWVMYITATAYRVTPGLTHEPAVR